LQAIRPAFLIDPAPTWSIIGSLQAGYPLAPRQKIDAWSFILGQGEGLVLLDWRQSCTPGEDDLKAAGASRLRVIEGGRSPLCLRQEASFFVF
jgi:hypothetical protein